MLEKQVERYLVNEVNRRGGLCMKFVSPGNAGVPDRIIVLPGGKVGFVEVKRPGGVIRPLQQYMLGKLERLGCEVAVLDSREAVDEFLT
jgi:hypothetical protein